MSEKKNNRAAAVDEVSTITLDTTDCQLSPEDLAERAEACGEVCDTAQKIHIEALGLGRHVERRFHLLSRAKMEEYIREIQRLCKVASAKLERLPYIGAVVLVCVLLSGCCGDGGGSYGSSGAGMAAPVSSCANGQCHITP